MSEPEHYEWVLCPNCSGKLFKDLGNDLNIEVACNSCKAIYHLQKEDGHISYTLKRNPRRGSRHFPTEHK